MAKFWWMSQSSSKGIHWCSWSHLAKPKAAGGMGFRDMSKFNVALLARQCWRLVRQPSCFLALVLKASLWSARGLIEKGYIWRIGSGASINIWNEPWLPGWGDNRVRNHDNDIRYTNVSNLIDQSSKQWRYEVIRELFDDDYVARICSIPLPRVDLADEIVWKYEGSDCYSVKSGYRLLQNPQPISSISFSDFYNAVWSLDLPSKIKIHMWRVANNLLPTFDNLQRRRLAVNNVCPFCQSVGEAVAHLLRDCDFVCQLMRVFQLPCDHIVVSGSWLHWLEAFFVRLSASSRRLVAMIYWVVWFSRNKLVHEGYKSSVYEAASFIKAFIREQDSVSVLNDHARHTGIARWEAPDLFVVKVNFDSAFNLQDRSAISGAVVWNSEGLILATCVVPNSNVSDGFMAEALACKDAVQVAKDMRFSEVIIEGDSLTVVKKLNSTIHDSSIIAPIIVDIKDLAKSFSSISFHFVRRGQIRLRIHWLVGLALFKNRAFGLGQCHRRWPLLLRRI
ncbi:hypothetical protein GQ457_07G011430 [Hibiscus cannabinus]